VYDTEAAPAPSVRLSQGVGRSSDAAEVLAQEAPDDATEALPGAALDDATEALPGAALDDATEALPGAALDDATEALPGAALDDATELLPQAELAEGPDAFAPLGDDATVVLPADLAAGEAADSPQASQPEADLIDLNTPPPAEVAQAGVQEPALSDGPPEGSAAEEEVPTGELDVTAQMPALSELAARAAVEDDAADEEESSEGPESPGGDATGEITAQLPSISQFADPNPWSVLKNALSETSCGGTPTASEGVSASEAEPTGDIAEITSQLPSLSHLAQQFIDAEAEAEAEADAEAEAEVEQERELSAAAVPSPGGGDETMNLTEHLPSLSQLARQEELEEVPERPAEESHETGDVSLAMSEDNVTLNITEALPSLSAMAQNDAAGDARAPRASEAPSLDTDGVGAMAGLLEAMVDGAGGEPEGPSAADAEEATLAGPGAPADMTLEQRPAAFVAPVVVAPAAEAEVTLNFTEASEGGPEPAAPGAETDVTLNFSEVDAGEPVGAGGTPAGGLQGDVTLDFSVASLEGAPPAENLAAPPAEPEEETLNFSDFTGPAETGAPTPVRHSLRSASAGGDVTMDFSSGTAPPGSAFRALSARRGHSDHLTLDLSGGPTGGAGDTQQQQTQGMVTLHLTETGAVEGPAPGAAAAGEEEVESPVPEGAVSFEQFVQEAEVQFLDHVRRGTSLGAPLREDEPPETLQECYQVLALTLSEITTVESAIAALQAEVKTRQEVVDQKEAQVSKHNPAIFQKLQQARGVGELDDLRNDIHQLKRCCRQQTAQSWKEWRGKLERQMGGALASNVELLRSDELFLQASREHVDTLQEAVQRHAAQLRAQEGELAAELEAAQARKEAAAAKADAVAEAERRLNGLHEAAAAATERAEGLEEACSHLGVRLEGLKAQTHEHALAGKAGVAVPSEVSVTLGARVNAVKALMNVAQNSLLQPCLEGGPLPGGSRAVLQAQHFQRGRQAAFRREADECRLGFARLARVVERGAEVVLHFMDLSREHWVEVRVPAEGYPFRGGAELGRTTLRGKHEGNRERDVWASLVAGVASGPLYVTRLCQALDSAVAAKATAA